MSVSSSYFSEMIITAATTIEADNSFKSILTRVNCSKTSFGASQVPKAVRLTTNIGLAPPSADTNATGPLPIA